MRLLLLYILITIGLYATYYDSDIDGVEDSIDQCMHTPFDELVDEFGCSQEDQEGTWMLTLGVDSGFDTFDEKSTSYNVAIDYNIKQWRFGLSNANYIGYDINGTSSREAGDIYSYVGYEVPIGVVATTFSVGLKIPTADESVGTGEYDYYMSTQMETLSSEDTKLFATLLYTYTGNTQSIKYNNIFAYSIGMGYTVNNNYYTSVYYENSQSIYEDTENYKALIWSNHYAYSEQYFVEFDYTRGLDDFSYTHMFSFRLGAYFE